MWEIIEISCVPREGGDLKFVRALCVGWLALMQRYINFRINLDSCFYGLCKSMSQAGQSISQSTVCYCNKVSMQATKGKEACLLHRFRSSRMNIGQLHQLGLWGYKDMCSPTLWRNAHSCNPFSRLNHKKEMLLQLDSNSMSLWSHVSSL